jgi:sulfate/thiosulfate transport system ATP-binding protein
MSITVQHITKTFGDFVALQDVSLTVAAGELVALLGPSGSGKTTLLRIIAGLEQPDAGSGDMYFDDQDVTFRHVRERGVGFVFQHYALFRHMSVFENVAFGLRVLPRRYRPSRAEIHHKVHHLLQLMQLPGLADRRPHQLSGGQRQRVALARALAVEPKVLLLDEPFGALDARVRQELRGWLRRLHDDLRVTSVLVTHDQDEALEVADRVVLMNHGRIEQVGTPDEVFHAPQTEFVMHFLGNVNCFHSRIEQGQAVFGSLTVGPSRGAWHEGAPAKLLVRPQDVQLRLRPNGTSALPAQVTRIKSAGTTVRVELLSAAGQACHAELPYEHFQEFPLTTGAQVFLHFRSARVFVEDVLCCAYTSPPEESQVTTEERECVAVS